MFACVEIGTRQNPCRCKVGVRRGLLLPQLSPRLTSALSTPTPTAQSYVSQPSPLALPSTPNHNPPKAQVLGPTLGAVLGLISAVVCVPVGAALWVCSRPRGRLMMKTPAAVYARVSGPIPL